MVAPGSQNLPAFLESWGELAVSPTSPEDTRHVNAVFRHKHPLGPAQTLWWPAGTKESTPDTVILFLPGNPGLLGFYIPFLTAIHAATSSSSLSIIAHGYLGLQSCFGGDSNRPDVPTIQLPAQIEAKLEVVDALRLAYGPKTKILLVGHSLGTWMALQILKARPDVAAGAFLLFPTVSDMGGTPNGKRFSHLFRPPLPRIISHLSVLVRSLPLRILSVLFPGWPDAQLLVLRTLLRSPSAIYTVLTLANNEIETIRELDVAVLDQHVEHLWLYFAEDDDWVGEQREHILRALHGTPAAVRVVHGHRDVPHAFSINHGEELATQCLEWLRTGNFV
ncbi:hypothetical protein BV25DRAFT_1870311 [Artomyces pyxidatus]|uniref:Uncharacterized protein n=1 Tax=Artomyces pyxidatus TaxID=48021 RepID=A0ACB8T3I8_9AGAM|nr:hypothetical protein BV25DRAFT_1870311 [Artomyces pyxidatus]